MNHRESLPDADALLRRVESAERDEKRGRLKVLLGYSSGVGKTCRLLNEGKRRLARGQDVVIAAIQENRPAESEKLLRSLEVIPLRCVEEHSYIDIPAVIERHPQICLIDGMAWDNPPGARRGHRWEDVIDILDSGISVVGTVNLQYIAEYQSRVAEVTGKHVAETVPLSFLYNADEIEIVDAPAITSMHTGEWSLEDPARKLMVLRELALVVAAEVVDRQLEIYLENLGISSQWGAQERILLFLNHTADASEMVQQAARDTARFHGELHAVYAVREKLNLRERQQLRQNLSLARQAGAMVARLEEKDAASGVIRFAAGHGITQVYLQKDPQRLRWNVSPGILDRLLQNAGSIDIQVFPNR